MKKLIFTLGLFVASFSFGNPSSGFASNEIAKGYGIGDGWYSATVYYTNYGTGTYSTYTLDVKVQYNTVVAIDFGNGGSVHSGYNNSGYTYSGGYLSFETNYMGNIVAATTTVSVYDSNSRSFRIIIE